MAVANYDIARMSLGNSGIDDYYWPLSKRDLTFVRDVFLSELIPFLRSESARAPHARVLSSLVPQILGDVLSTFQAQALINRARRDGRSPLFSSHAHLSISLEAGIVPNPTPTVSRLRQGIATESLFRPVARAVRSALRRDVVRRVPMRTVDMRHDVVTVATGEMISQHALSVGSVKFLPLSNWFAPLDQSSSSFAGPPPRTFIDSVLNIVQSAFVAGGEQIDNNSAKYIRGCVEESMELADRYLGRLLTTPRYVPMHLWRGTGGLIWARLLSFACQELGGEVTGHDHSHGQGAWSSYSDTIIELPFCDRFMVWTQMQRDMALRNLRPELYLPQDPPEIFPVLGRFKPKILPTSNERQTSRVKERRPVAMYVATLYTDDFVPFTPLQPSGALIDWELRLFFEMRRIGYEVLYKPHPESKNQLSPPQLESLGVRVIDGRFEDVYDQADVLLFAQANSTSFWGALGTEKSIVLVNEPLNPWQPEARKMVEERCAIVNTQCGPDNRLFSDWGDLERGLDVAEALRSNDFYERFFVR